MVILTDLKSFEKVCGALSAQVIGRDADLRTPFGTRRCVYADFTASGRAITSIEEYIRDEVLPLYGNVHSLSTSTARQAGYYRSEAREVIRNYLGGTHRDAIIFAGNGATGAAQTFIDIMERQLWAAHTPDLLETRWHTYICPHCENLQIDNESAAKAHINTESHIKKVPKKINEKLRLVIFLVDPTLHHSSFLGFREMKNRYFPDEELWVRFYFEFLETKDTKLSISDLECKLESIKITKEVWLKEDNVFSTKVFCILNACSNVTGCTLSVTKCNKLIHKYDGIAVWDFASAGGSIKLNGEAGDEVDVAFLSPHKLLGGPGSSGVLVVKKRLLGNDVPGTPGGGVVRFVSKRMQLYTLNREEREEAGTPNIIACIRTGMVMRLHSLLPRSLICAREIGFLHMILQTWSREKRIQILGPLYLPRFDGNINVGNADKACDVISTQCQGVRRALVSFMIKYGNDLTKSSIVQSTSVSVSPGCEIVAYANKRSIGGLYLHHNFVSAVLNDVFGVQTRPGCSCAGPLAHEVLGLDATLVEQYQNCLETTGLEVFRPGFTRISLHYSMTIDDVEIIAHAVSWVAQFGWQLLPYYTFNAESGEWRQNVVKPSKFRKWLSDCNIHPVRGFNWQNTTNHKEEPLIKKDPKRIVGAVAMPGMVDAMKEMFSKRKPNVGEVALKKMAEDRARREAAINVPKENDDRPKTVAEMRQAIEQKKPDKVTPEPLAQSEGEQVSRVKSIASKWEKVPLQSRSKTVESPKRFNRRIPSQNIDESKQSAKGSSELHFSDSLTEKQCFSQKKPPSDSSDIDYVPATELHRDEDDPHERINIPLIQDVLEKDSLLQFLARKNHRKSPEELQEYYDSAHEIISALEPNANRSGDSARLLQFSKNSLSPPLPSDYAHLLWFALPGDAVYSMGLFNKPPNDGEPTLALKSYNVGAPFWIGDCKVARPINSPFEVAEYPPDATTLKDTTAILASGDEVMSWINSTITAFQPQSKSALAGEILDFKTSTPLFEARDSQNRKPSDDSQSSNGIVVEKICPRSISVIPDSDSYGIREVLTKNYDEVYDIHEDSHNDVHDSSSQDTKSNNGNSKLISRSNESISTKFTNPYGVCIATTMRRKVGRAIRQFKMLQEGDKVLVGLSGGKDSMTMLHMLLDLTRRSPVKFSIAVATVNPMTPEYDPTALKPYVEDLGLTFHMLEYPIIDLAKQKMDGNSLCSFCARIKRGMLYSCMSQHGYNVLALGQHMDDIAESFLMSAFYNGALNTMKAHYRTTHNDTVIRCIRPLVYVRERELAAFVEQNNLRIIAENCPACFDAPKKRNHIKHLLAKEEFEDPATVINISKAVAPLMAIDSTEKYICCCPEL